MEERKLNEQIANALAARPTVSLRIVLDNGSDVTDLKSCADVRVTLGEQERDFTFLSQRFIAQLFKGPFSTSESDESSYIYSADNPLIIDKEINGEIIVRGILRYLRQERLH